VSMGLTRNLGQDLFAPPNVKGWDGGLSWITTNNLLARYNEAALLVLGDRAALAAAMAGRKKTAAAGNQAERRLRNLRPGAVDVEKILTAEQRKEKLRRLKAAVQAHVLPRELSFKHTVQVWLAWSQKQFLSDAPEDLTALFRLIAYVRVGKRPGRIEPRAIKQRPKPFARLQTTRRTARRNIGLYGHPQRLRA